MDVYYYELARIGEEICKEEFGFDCRDSKVSSIKLKNRIIQIFNSGVRHGITLDEFVNMKKFYNCTEIKI